MDTSSLFGKLCLKLRAHPKRIVFPDGEDLRVLQVAEKMVSMELGIPIILGKKNNIKHLAKSNDINLTFVRIIDPSAASEVALFAKRLEKVSRYQGKEIANPQEIVSRPHNFGAMMVQYGHADGMVAGNASMPVTTFRAVLRLIKPLKNIPHIFGAFIMHAPQLKHFGSKGMVLLADCGVIPEPTVQQLASIAIETGRLAHRFLESRPRIALLSHSTKGSSSTDSAKKMAAAATLARQKARENYLDMDIEGELQADVAIDPRAAEIKLADAHNRGSADVLVFPNLDAGNIALKLLESVAGLEGYGQLIIGLSRPAAQVPKTISVHALLATVVAVGVEAIESHELLEENLAQSNQELF